MKKKYLIWLVSVITLVTIFLVGAGVFFSEEENEKMDGLAGFYDVSPQGTIAYLDYTEGKPQIWLHSESSPEANPIEFENDRIILDLAFSADGSTLAFISTNKDMETETESQIFLLDLETMETEVAFITPSVVTELAFSPEDRSLFYLNAGTFENYSPIVGERPHNFDIHEYVLAEKEHIQHTDWEKYSMNSLTVASDGNAVFVQMPDDADVETAEDSFEVNQRIFEIPLDEPDNLKIVTKPDREVDIFDFAVMPGEKEFIFQSISNPEAGDTFQYELYKYNVETDQEEQLTHLKEYTSHPVVNENQGKIYFMVDTQFAGRNSDYHLYRMNLDGTEVEEVAVGEKKE